MEMQSTCKRWSTPLSRMSADVPADSSGFFRGAVFADNWGYRAKVLASVPVQAARAV